MNATQKVEDARLKKLPRNQLGIENQSRVFAAFDDDTKMTVKDVRQKLNILPDETTKLNERTVRRAIDALVKNGFLIQVGKQDNAILYAKRSTNMTDESSALIPLGGDLVSLAHFVEVISNVESDPFKVKLSTLNESTTLALRRQMLFSVLSAGETGHNAQLAKVAKNLHLMASELKHALSMVESLLNSPIWYDQYRDPIGYQVRNLQKNNPDLFKLAVELMKGG